LLGGHYPQFNLLLPHPALLRLFNYHHRLRHLRNLDGYHNLHHDGNFHSLRDYDYNTIRMMVRMTLWAGEGLVSYKGTELD